MHEQNMRVICKNQREINAALCIFQHYVCNRTKVAECDRYKDCDECMKGHDIIIVEERVVKSEVRQ